MKRYMSLVIAGILSCSLMNGCSKVNEDNVINITILNSKPEITSAVENVIETYENEYEGARIKLIQYSQSGSYRDKVASMAAAENAPTLTLVDAADIRVFSDLCLDLSSEDWVLDISGEISDIAYNQDGQVIAFPFSTEGAGLIYNKAVMEEAGIDVSTIHTTAALEEAFQKVNAIGKDAIIITNEEWSLGDHFLATFYAADIMESGVSAQDYFSELSKNADDLGDNMILNGLMDTFDLMKNYNMYADSPLTVSYDKCSEILGKGEAGFWYMGNWASQNIINASGNANEFGFIPVPVSNDASNYGNTAIAVGITKYFIVNKNASEAQQEEAKRFLNYLVYDENGTKFMVDDCGVIPAFSNIQVEQNDPLVKEILHYREQNQTMELMNSYLPANNSKILGLALRKYLNHELTREQFIEQMETFWSESADSKQ